MRKLCRAAKELDMPLEINLLGLRTGRNYPDDLFWRIAGEEGNTAVLGCDAHKPEQLCAAQWEKTALELAEKYRLNLLQTVPIRRL